MDWQTLVVALVVGLAIAVLVRRIVRWLSNSGSSSCSGCSNAKSSPATATTKIITDDEIGYPNKPH